MIAKPKIKPQLGKETWRNYQNLPFDCGKPQDYVFKHLDHAMNNLSPQLGYAALRFPYNSLNDALRNRANNQMSSIFRKFLCHAHKRWHHNHSHFKKSNKIMGKPGINMTSPRVPFTECPPPDVEELPPHLYVSTPEAEFWKIMHQTK